jgi:hypothetical protein
VRARGYLVTKMCSVERRILQDEDIKTQLAEATALCRAALSEPEMVVLTRRLRNAPANACGWFDLLSGYPTSKAAHSIERMKHDPDLDGAAAFPSIEHYAILQALTVSLPRVHSLPLAFPVKRKIAELAVQVAHPSGQWKRNLSAGHSLITKQMVELATLRAFPAGELIFDFEERVRYAWLLRFPPPAVPGFLFEVIFGLKGLGPVILPHINRWRPNPLFVRKLEVERSLWRIAKTLEFRPDVKFLLSDSWLHSADLKQNSPHLAWLRTIYEEAGAYIVSMEPAQEDSGLKELSPKRAELYDAGAFAPRRTLVFWRRDDMLTWAAQRMHLADEGECAPSLPAARSSGIRVRSPKPARASKHNSPIHLWSGLGLLARRPRTYFLLVLILPALVIAGAASALGWWMALPGFAVAFIAAWLFQYYAFQ